MVVVELVSVLVVVMVVFGGFGVGSDLLLFGKGAHK